jgi:hypothetical protein
VDKKFKGRYVNWEKVISDDIKRAQEQEA